MALQLSKTLEHQVDAAAAYAKIIGVNYATRLYPEVFTGIRIVVAFYFDKDARDADDADFIEIKEYDLADTTKESRADQYTYLKTLDDFVGATDV